MPEAGPKEIRLYCVCGQRMKISADMFGRKGKCIACRQKLRVPYLDEIPKGETKVYLKDHPEFLRKPYLAGHAAVVAGEKPEKKKDGFESIIIPGDFVKPVMEGDSDDPAMQGEGAPGQEPEERLFPLDEYKPLRALCNLEYKAEKRRAEAPESNGDLRDFEGRLRQAREKMEAKFRDRIVEVRLKLAEIGQELLDYNDELRAGTLTYSAYRSKVRSMRHRREGFARLLHNLRAWLQVHDPYSAGGHEDLSEGMLPAAFPLPHPEDDPVPSDIALNGLLQELHEGFRARVEADKRLEECQRLCDGGVLRGTELEEARAEAMAEKARARARVLFARARIAESERDFERDASALECNLKIAEEAFGRGAMSERGFKALQADLEQGRRDNEEARDLARRALSANSAADVPAPRGTFFERLVNTGYVKDLGTDRWLGLAAAGMLIATSLLPLTPEVNNWAVLPEFCAGLIFAALCTAGLTLVKAKPARALLYTALWVALSVGCGFYLHELRFTAEPAGEIVRGDAQWWLRPGILGLMLSVALLGAATSVAATVSRRRVPLSPIVGVLLITGGIALTITHLGGLLAPALAIGAVEVEPVNALRSAYHVVVPVENTGRRVVWLVQDSATLPFPVGYSLERGGATVGTPRLRPLQPDAVQRGNGGWVHIGEAMPLMPGEKLALRYQLAPGAYEFTLASDRVAGMPLKQAFVLEAGAGVTVPPLVPHPATQMGQPGITLPDIAGNAAESVHAPNVLQLELQGVVKNAEGEPLFMLTISWPDGTKEQRRIKLDQVVFGPWRAQEFNPGSNSLTFSNGEVLRVLNKQDVLHLPLDE